MSTPLGIDNPIKIKQDIGSFTWSLYWKETMEKIATFNDQFTAYSHRQYLLNNNTPSAS